MFWLSLVSLLASNSHGQTRAVVAPSILSLLRLRVPLCFLRRFSSDSLNITVSLTFSMRLTTSCAGPTHVCVAQVDHQEKLPFAASLKSSFGQLRCQEVYLPAALHMSAASRSPSEFFRPLHVFFFVVSSTWKMAFVTFMVNVTCLRFNAK